MGNNASSKLYLFCSVYDWFVGLSRLESNSNILKFYFIDAHTDFINEYTHNSKIQADLYFLKSRQATFSNSNDSKNDMAMSIYSTDNYSRICIVNI